ncbi:hypothetical protein SUGI_0733600 [Cryptomeria japonica]|uniref:protein ASPARTIC PROTEASE IN GUARD CELL 2-like n=1 Tax=Cryptomeria japonica TaxID=3369 RepID=UPI002414C4C3|nr:protein ASPARTIC PROTEASE IN GUARD CELL 2-like [Cryptomeria japonica]GLJ36517.1 hypothetical protein SUGI_0733600 [Cryptomeria japonica]
MGLCRLLVPLSVWVIITLYTFLFFGYAAWAEKRGGFHYHALNITAQLREVSSPTLELYKTYQQEKYMGKNPWTLQVFHRDSLVGGNVSYEQRFKERLRRESRRVKALNRRVERKLKGKEKERRIETKAKTEDFGGEVTSGMMEGSGEYFTRIGVGTPAREQYLVLDTGSDVVWVQCQPCNDCYDQTDPIFDPSTSASFTSVSCGSAVCNELEKFDCNSHGCAYQVAYGDGSYSVGSFGTETLTFGNTRVQNVALGCGHDNQGWFVGAAGLLGLGAGALSIPSQLGSLYGTKFSYCLVDRSSESSGVLDFGPGSVSPVGSVFVPLLRNPRLSTFYYVPLTAISVGGLLVSFPQKVFEFDETGRGGVIVDSGTAVTRLQRDAYEAVRDAFVVSTQHLLRAEGMSIFDTCYNFAGLQTVRVPTVSFHFLNGVVLTLPAENYLVPVDVMGTFCLAFAPTSDSLSIIGNIQQQGVRVSIDSVNSFVGFAINQC